MKAFNNIYFEHLGSLKRPAGHPERSALSIAGDGAPAKLAVTDFLNAIGYDAIDVGPLAESWRLQPDTPAYGQPYVQPGTDFWAAPGRPATARLLKEQLDAAMR